MLAVLTDQRSIDTVCYMFSKLVSVLGVVRPTCDENFHLRCRHAGSDETTTGQHLFGKPETSHRGPILGIELVRRELSAGSSDAAPSPRFSEPPAEGDLDLLPLPNTTGAVTLQLKVTSDPEREPAAVAGLDLEDGEPVLLMPSSSQPRYVPAEAALDETRKDLIASADVIVFPIGSFFTSVLANLVVTGVGRAVAGCRCPKVYIPNAFHDPEAAGHTVADCVGLLLAQLRQDAGADTPTADLLSFVLVDSRNVEYAHGLDCGEFGKQPAVARGF